MTATTIDIAEYCEQLARGTRTASRQLSTATGAQRDRALEILACLLREEDATIRAANAEDIAAAPGFGISAAAVDRLRLTPSRIAAMADAVDEIRVLPDPIGTIIRSNMRPNGLEIQKVRVPLGVIFFIYESRPNVTTDAAALCLKSANAVILRGGKEAQRSNLAVAKLVRRALEEAGLPAAAVSMVEIAGREVVGQLLRMDQSIDVVIPRGGEALIRRVAEEATMPVIKHFKGNCHVYVDASADAEMAVNIVENAKCQRPGVCNAAETLLVHEQAAVAILPRIARRLADRNVELRGCPRTCAILDDCKAATEDDFFEEFLDLILAVKIVDSLEEAVAHIHRYGSGHTESIVTNEIGAARRFAAAVDSSAVIVNASTRFNDGGQFGLGAEIGISTDKLHARGPCGLEELTSYKYVVFGSGQIRS